MKSRSRSDKLKLFVLSFLTLFMRSHLSCFSPLIRRNVHHLILMMSCFFIHRNSRNIFICYVTLELIDGPSSFEAPKDFICCMRNRTKKNNYSSDINYILIIHLKLSSLKKGKIYNDSLSLVTKYGIFFDPFNTLFMQLDDLQ